jgi:hypothetical protein
MSHFDFAKDFRALYDLALAQYAAGKRGADTYFNAQQKAFLAANGITAQHMYDYAEDDHNEGEPGYDRALTIESVRRDYFLNIQRGVASKVVLDEATLPEKSATARGITWLPRIIPKARAKLRGELPGSLMYCCGGDRQFLKKHDFFPAEFLSLVWRHENDDDAIIEGVIRRSAEK